MSVEGPESTPRKVVFIVEGILPATLNQLLHMNRWKRSAITHEWEELIQRARGNRNPHFGKGPVRIQYISYRSKRMDWDAVAASFKPIGDALVACGIIDDDGPSIVVKLDCEQVVVKREEVGIKVIIELAE